MQTQGERLEEIMTISRLDRDELAIKIKSSVAQIGKVIRNEGNFGIEVYCNLINNLNVSVDWLLSGKGSMFIVEKTENISDGFKSLVKAEVALLLHEYGLINEIK